MRKATILVSLLLLTSCCRTPSSGQVSETISPTDYQACIQAAKSGNGAASDEKCEKVMQDTR
jgi:uncharacterized lipoprotein YajG